MELESQQKTPVASPAPKPPIAVRSNSSCDAAFSFVRRHGSGTSRCFNLGQASRSCRTCSGASFKAGSSAQDQTGRVCSSECSRGSRSRCSAGRRVGGAYYEWGGPSTENLGSAAAADCDAIPEVATKEPYRRHHRRLGQRRRQLQHQRSSRWCCSRSLLESSGGCCWSGQSYHDECSNRSWPCRVPDWKWPDASQYVERRVPLGDHRLLTFVAQYMACAWEIAYNHHDELAL